MTTTVKATMVSVVPSSTAAQVLQGAGLRDIIAERVEQIDLHGFTPAHDLGHHPAEIARGAEAYLRHAVDQLLGGAALPRLNPGIWPWEREAWRPGDARANLVKAIAMAWAVVDRLDHNDTAGIPA